MPDGGGQLMAFGPFIDADGEVRTSVKIYHYAAGTTSNLAAWSDEARTSPLADPWVTSDASGIFSAFFDGDYKIVIDDSDDVNILTIDNWKITADTATMWEGNKGTSYPAASAANKGHMFALVDGSDNFLELGVNATGSTFTPVAQPIGKGADIASAATLVTGLDGNYFDVTGTTTITAIQASRVGRMVWLHFDAALILTHHATNLILPEGNNITTVAGYEALFIEYASGQWRLINDNKNVTLQSAYNIIISTEPGADYVTMAAYIAGSPAAGDRVLIKVDETLTTPLVIPADIEITQQKGKKFTSSLIMSPLIQFGDNVKTKGDLRVEKTDAATAAGFGLYGDNNHHDNLVVENKGTGIIVNAILIAAGAVGNYAQAQAINSGAGSITNDLDDDSTNDENHVTVRGDAGIAKSNGVNKTLEIVKWSKGVDIPSAAALAPGNDGNYFDVTGTTAITSINTKGLPGTEIKLHFDGILTLTHHATNLILPGGTNITTAAGDEYTFTEYDTGQWRLTAGSKAGVAGSSVGQPELKTTSGSVSTLSTTYVNLTLPGGQHGFYPRTSNPGGGLTSAVIASVRSGGTASTNIALLTDHGAKTAYADQLYFQASPPYKIGNVVWGHFLFVLREIATGKVISAYQAEDPPWAYNGYGPKDSPERIARVPHPFSDYFNKPVPAGLEIALIDLKGFNVPSWRGNLEKQGKGILEDLDIVKVGNIKPPQQFNLPEIPGFTDKIKIRAGNTI